MKKTVFNKNETISILSEKIDDGTLSYNNIFETNYGSFDERNSNTMDELDMLSKKFEHNLKNNRDDKNFTINIDDILQNNLDKIVDRLVDEKYFKYGIYGSNKDLWFVKDEKQKAPLNYFQQRVLLYASPATLRKLMVLTISRLTSGDKVYIPNYGSFWVFYGDGNHFSEGLAMLKQTINKIEEKYYVKKQKLNKSDLNILKTIIGMKKFNNIKANSFGELVSKKVLLSKSKDIVKRCEKILSNIKNQNKISSLH